MKTCTVTSARETGATPKPTALLISRPPSTCSRSNVIEPAPASLRSKATRVNQTSTLFSNRLETGSCWSHVRENPPSTFQVTITPFQLASIRSSPGTSRPRTSPAAPSRRGTPPASLREHTPRGASARQAVCPRSHPLPPSYLQAPPRLGNASFEMATALSFQGLPARTRSRLQG